MKSEIISFLFKTSTFSFFLLVLLVQSAQLSAAEQQNYQSNTIHQQPLTTQYSSDAQASELQKSIQSIAHQLFSNLEDQDPQIGLLSEAMAVTVFVDLKKLTRTSSFGRYLAEQLMTEFQQQGYPVLELRKSKTLMVQEKRGEYGLSRDIKEIESSQPARTMLTGTYTIAGDHIMVNAKILDNKNSLMLSSATALFTKNSLTEALLADSASAFARVKTNIYMKKLDI